MITAESFLGQLNGAIASNKITLPTLPEVALKVRDAVERHNSTAHDIANIVATDAAVSARLLQVANSPLYRGRVEIDNLHMAVTRLGLRLVRSLVASVAMRQIFQATSDMLDHRFRMTWESSVEVAALSHFLAQQTRHLDKEQALLAGLIHNIGGLPILMLADQLNLWAQDIALVDHLIDQFSPEIGHRILRQWHFPETLTQVAAHYRDFSHSSGAQIDYADIVIVARLQTLSPQHPDHQLDWSQIPSCQKLGIEQETVVMAMPGAAEQTREINALFS